MRCVTEYVRSLDKTDSRPWLVLGKGPSASRHESVNLDKYRVFALNHAWRIYPQAQLVHFSDLEAFAEEAEDIYKSPPLRVCLPWHPHEKNKPSRHTLAELAVRAPCRVLLTRLMAQHRIFSYNSSIASKLPVHPRLLPVRIRFFSAEAGFQIVINTRTQNQTVYSLGVDGGSAYAPMFSKHTLLANGRKSFDVQFAEIQRTCRLRRAKWIKL